MVGGGAVAERKVDGLCRCGARVTVVSPTLTPRLAARADGHEIEHRARPYRRGDLKGFVLAVVACGDRRIGQAVAAEAERAGVMVNVVDAPRYCSFFVPAVLERGQVVVAVSTGGASPALARRIRGDLEGVIGDEHALAAEIMGRIRERLPAGPERRHILMALARSALLDHLRASRRDEVDALLEEAAGCTLASLGVDLRAGG